MSAKATHGRWRPMVTAALAATGVAAVGALTTELGPWYYNLALPGWKPPDWLFGPAWTLIFGLAAISGYLSWSRAPRNDVLQARIIALFAINALLNIAWSVLFFRLHRPDWALLEVILLWLSIVALMVMTYRSSRLASLLLLPYLLWVSFAGVLNYSIVRLNGL
ncbi:MAG: tryptophan-rich sensory protein [Proteobacteria bacterium]|nr:tryptophan-rich sensory protein [Pseudomonadota bacterium]